MPASVEALASAIDSDARRSDEASDSRIRVELAAEASRDKIKKNRKGCRE